MTCTVYEYNTRVAYVVASIPSCTGDVWVSQEDLRGGNMYAARGGTLSLGPAWKISGRSLFAGRRKADDGATRNHAIAVAVRVSSVAQLS